MSITFVVLNQTKKRIAFLKILSILLVACLGCVTLHAQSALEISLEKKINERYSTPRKLIKEYEELLSKKAYSSPVDQNIIKVYLAFCREALEQSKAVGQLDKDINYPFSIKKNPLANCRRILLTYIKHSGDTLVIKQLMQNIQFAQDKKFNTFLADAYFKLGFRKRNNNDIDSAKYFLEKCYTIAEKNNLYAQQILSQTQFAYINLSVDGDRESYKQKCLKNLALAYEHKLIVLSAEQNRGLFASYNQRDEDSSIYYLKKSIQLYDSVKMDKGTVRSLVSLSFALGNAKKTVEAQSYLKKAEAICLKEGIKSYLPYIYNNWVSTIPEDSVQAKIQMMKKCIQSAKEQKNDMILMHGSINLGALYNQNHSFLKAQKAYQEARNVLNKLKGKLDKSIFNRRFVAFHLDWKKYKPQEFAKYGQPINYVKSLHEAEKTFIELREFSQLASLYRTYINYYQSVDLKKVIKYQELLINAKDSLSLINSESVTSKYAEDLKTAEKEKDIIKLKADNAIAELEKKQLLFGSILALILLSLLGYYIYKRIQKRNAEEQKERTLAIRHKLSNDLHDEVGSNLTGLALMAEGISMSDNPSKTSIDKLATLSRSTMTTMRDTVWAIDSRKDSVGDLVARIIDFGQDLFEDSETLFKIKQEIENDKKPLPTEIRQNIYLLYKEALSNAAKHSKGNELNLFIKQTNKSFELKIHNNGDVDEKIKGSGLGLESMRERAEAFGGTFTLDTQDGFTVRAIFPL